MNSNEEMPMVLKADADAERARKQRASAALRPAGDRIVCVKMSAARKSTGGIVLPGTAQENCTRAEVLAVGPGRWLETGGRAPMATKAGDIVYLGKYSGTEIDVDGYRVLIVSDADVLAVVGG